MKKEEMRIGNLYHSTTFGGSMLIVNNDFYKLTALDMSHVHTYGADIFQPIRITREVLESIGLNIIDKYYLDVPNIGLSGLSRFVYLDEDGSVSFRVDGCITICKVYYVHDLQNLYYSITKEELLCVSNA